MIPREVIYYVLVNDYLQPPYPILKEVNKIGIQILLQVVASKAVVRKVEALPVQAV